MDTARDFTNRLAHLAQGPCALNSGDLECGDLHSVPWTILNAILHEALFCYEVN